MDTSEGKRDFVWILSGGQDFNTRGGSRRTFQKLGRYKQRSKAGREKNVFRGPRGRWSGWNKTFTK